MRVWVRRGWVGIAALVAACAGSARQYDPPPQAVSCDQANAAAYRAVRAMGYVPTTIELATRTQSGMVRASTHMR